MGGYNISFEWFFIGGLVVYSAMIGGECYYIYTIHVLMGIILCLIDEWFNEELFFFLDGCYIVFFCRKCGQSTLWMMIVDGWNSCQIFCGCGDYLIPVWECCFSVR